MAVKRGRSYFTRVLSIDFETSGLAFGELNPTYDPIKGERFAPVSVGAIVADAQTLKPIEELYLEIMFDESTYTWTQGAQNVHGLTREYLARSGVTKRDAAVQLAQMIERHWGPDLGKHAGGVRLLGQNVMTFDRFFLQDLMSAIDQKVSIGSRCVDTSTIGYVMHDMYDSNELFEHFGLVREDHNALEDARMALQVVRLSRTAARNMGMF